MFPDVLQQFVSARVTCRVNLATAYSGETQLPEDVLHLLGSSRREAANAVHFNEKPRQMTLSARQMPRSCVPGERITLHILLDLGHHVLSSSTAHPKQHHESRRLRDHGSAARGRCDHDQGTDDSVPDALASAQGLVLSA